MKELYIAPELELLCLAAEESLAQGELDFGEILGGPEQGESVMPDFDIEVIL